MLKELDLQTESTEQDTSVELEKKIASLFDEEEKVFLNPGNKFNSARQTLRYFEDLEELPKKEAQTNFEQRLKEDFRSFYLEFLRGKAVLPNPVSLRNGKIVCTEYGNCELLDLTSEVERDGAYTTAIRDLTEKVNTSPKNSFFAFTSPPGWHGMTDSEGTELPPHQESQTWVYFLDRERKLSSMTLRTGMNLEESKDFLEKFGLHNSFWSEFSEKDKLVTVSQSVVSGEAKNIKDASKFVLQNIQGAMKTQTAWMRDNKDPFSFEEITSEIESLETGSLVPHDIEKIINQVAKKASRMNVKSEKDIKKLVKLIGQTVIDMTIKTDGITGTKTEQTKQANRNLEEKIGCSGGGASAEHKTMTINGEIHYLVKKCPHCNNQIEKYIKAGYRCQCGEVFRGC